MFQPPEPVEIFDQFVFLILTEFKKVVLRKFVEVVFNRFIHTLGFNAINLGNIAIKQDFVSPDFQNRSLQVFNADRAFHSADFLLE